MDDGITVVIRVLFSNQGETGGLITGSGTDHLCGSGSWVVWPTLLLC